MVTIKDIAKMAGVSHGTVSNVLNKRGNVSVEKIKLVEEVSNKLGYSINAQAKQLRKRSSLSSCIAVIVPNIVETKYSTFFTSIKKYFEELCYTVSIFVTDDKPYIEKDVVNTIAAIRAIGIIAITCCKDILDIYDPVLKIGSHLIFIERYALNCTNYIGFDFNMAGYKIANEIKKNKFKNVGFITGLDFFSNEKEFKNGFLSVLKDDDDYKVNIVNTSSLTALKSSFNLFSNNNIPDVVVTTSSSLADSVQKAFSIGLNDKQPIIYTLDHVKFFNNNDKIITYYLDYGNLGIEASAQILNDINSKKTPCVGKSGYKKNLNSKGFLSHKKISPMEQKMTINVLMVKSQSTDALINITPQFTKETNINVNFTVLPLREMYQTILKAVQDNFFDVIRINVPMLPLLSSKSLIPIDKGLFTRITEGMIPKVVNEYSYINGVPFAIPFDVGTQLLIYRKDLFIDPMIKRMYYEMNNKNLVIPNNFSDYNKIARFFTRKYNNNSPVEYGTSTALGTCEDIFTHYILRLLSYGGKFIDSDGNNILNINAANDAINNYIELLNYSNCIYDSYWCGENINSFINGNTAMEIIYINYSSNIIDLHKSKIGGQIGYNFIPGNSPVFGGGSLAVSRNSKNVDASLKFIEWACCANNAEIYTFLGGISPHKHVYENSEILNIYPWYSQLTKTAEMSIGSEIWNKINFYDLERIVDLMIRSVISGALTVEEGSNLLKRKIDNYLR